MARHYKYQPRVRTRKQNNSKSDVGTRKMTIKKIEVIGEENPKEIKLIFNGGTKYTIRRVEVEYNEKKFWLLSLCLAVGDKAKVIYDKSTSQIIRCNINFEIRPCNSTLTCYSDWDNQILTITYLDEGRTEEKILDSSIKYINMFNKTEVTYDIAKEKRYIADEIVYISGRLAGIVGF